MTRTLLTLAALWLSSIYWLPAPLTPPTQAGDIYLPVIRQQPDVQPTFPIRAAFYYPWFPEAWRLRDGVVDTQFQPTAGYYDLSDPAVIQQQIAAMQYGHIEAGIISWWSFTHQSDQRVAPILAATRGSTFRWALYYEREARGDPTVDELRADLQTIAEHYGSDPSYLRIGGRFVVFVYSDDAIDVDDCEVAARWRQANTVNAFIILKIFSGARACATQPDLWHQYGPATASSDQTGYSFSISPGFWKHDEANARLARDLDRWRTDIGAMVASGAPLHLITTFNEWGEGTAVESAAEWASPSGYGLFLDALHEAPAKASDISALPTVALSVTLTVTPTPPLSPTATLILTDPVPTVVITTTPIPTSTVTITPTPTGADTATATLPATVTMTATETPTNSPTATATATATTIPTATATDTPTGALLRITPVADSYVNAGNAQMNYGAADQLLADKSPVTRSYLRFAVPAITGVVTRATLRLYTLSDGRLGYEVRPVADTTWGETTLTYANAPAFGDVIDTASGAAAGSWSETDLTRLVTGAGDLSVVLLNPTTNAMSYASRELVTDGGSLAPQLVIETAAAPPPTPTGGLVINAVGDIAGCDATGDEAVAALLDRLPGPILTLGDTVYESGTTSEFANCFDPAWGRHKARIRPAVGNHEYLTANAAPYFAYFGAAAGDPIKGYYSYTLGDWQIFVLNSNCSRAGGCDTGSPQNQWLRTELAAHPARCTLAYIHHPLWSSSKYQLQKQVEPLVQALHEGNADLLLAGHAHNYERFAPQDPAGNFDPDRGIVEIIAGAGGKNHQAADFAVLPNSKVRNGDTFGVLQLTLYADQYHWRFVPVAGGTFTDEGWAHCH